MSASSCRTLLGLAAGGLLLAGPAAVAVRAADPAGVAWRTDYHAARKEAQERGLPLLVELGTDECVYCRKQDATTFRDRGLVALVNTQFVPVRVDGAREPAFVQALRVQMFPTTVLAAPDGRVLSFLGGYVSAEQLRDHAQKAVVTAAIPAPVEKLARKDPPPPPAPVTAEPPVTRAAQARGLLATARDEFGAKKYADCLHTCDRLVSGFADLPEGSDGAALASQVRDDPDRLTAANDQLNERSAALYLTLGEAWAKKGQSKEARACLEKAVQLHPGGKAAETALARLGAFQKSETRVVSTDLGGLK